MFIDYKAKVASTHAMAIDECEFLASMSNKEIIRSTQWPKNGNKHVVSCYYFLKMCCHRSRLVFNCCFL